MGGSLFAFVLRSGSDGSGRWGCGPARAHGGPRCEFPAKARAVTVSIVHSMFSMSRVRKYVYIKKRGNTSTSTVKVHNADCQFSAFPVPSRLCRHIAAKVQLVH